MRICNMPLGTSRENQVGLTLNPTHHEVNLLGDFISRLPNHWTPYYLEFRTMEKVQKRTIIHVEESSLLGCGTV
jgi:hypothetical protein